LVYNPTWPSNLRQLEVVLQVLRKHKLFVKLFKCSVRLTQTNYLGHMVSGQGIAIDASKVQVVLAWPLLINLKQLKGFLGLIVYYKKFMKGYASVNALLTKLLKKDNFSWDVVAIATFEKLKYALTKTLY